MTGFPGGQINGGRAYYLCFTYLIDALVFDAYGVVLLLPLCGTISRITRRSSKRHLDRLK